jgi:transposase
MDVANSYPLVTYTPGAADGQALVPLTADLADSDDEPDFFAWLRQRLLVLALLLLLALRLIRTLRLERVLLRQQAHYWHSQHRRAKERESKLQQQVQLLQAQIRDLESRLHGHKSEKTAPTTPTSGTPGPRKTPRPRGQQRGARGPSRRNYDQLPTSHESCQVPPQQQCCGTCGAPWRQLSGTDDGHILEIEVRAHRRVYHRQRYQRTCTCPQQPVVVTAPPPPKVIPKGILGVSLWVMILEHKFALFQPLYRILIELRSLGLDLSAGTVTGGLQKMLPLLQPLYEALVEHNRSEGHWHADETRWLVFERRADKAGFAWSLWVFAAAESVVFVLDPTRAHEVPENHFGDHDGILNVDRYSAYKAMRQVKAGRIVLAFCWAHVRRDFLAVLTSWPELSDWAWSWLEDIALLYQHNAARRRALDNAANAASTASVAGATADAAVASPSTALVVTPAAALATAERLLRQHVDHLAQRRDRELAQTDLRAPQAKALKSLQNHWAGLTVFLDHPEVPLDNNEAERRERGPVVARKNYYGSGRLWSGRLAAMLFSLFHTLSLWDLDLRAWLTRYLTACAEAGGQPPAEATAHLPWNMTPEQRAELMPKTQSAKPRSDTS